jgi:hypothetical protein
MIYDCPEEMDMTTNEIVAAALGMDAPARASLAEKLLRSLEDVSEEEIDRLWLEEALRRDAEFDAGTAKARDAEDVFRDARARFS